MLTSDRPGVGGHVRRLLVKVSPVGGWPTRHPVNNCQVYVEQHPGSLKLLLLPYLKISAEG